MDHSNNAAPSLEAKRLEALQSLKLLDTPPEQVFDNLAALAREVAATPIALVSLVDEHRQWFKAKVGIEACETAREHAFCAHAIKQADVMWIEDARLDARFAKNPLVVGPPHIRFYAGAPIEVDDFRIGTVCVISDAPRPKDERLAESLTRLALLAADACVQRLLSERLNAAREQAAAGSEAKSRFLAHMSHELRTPLNGITAAVSILQASAPEESREMLGLIERSASSLCELLDDILDLARIEAGRMELQLEAFSLDDLLTQIGAFFRLRAEEKGLELGVANGLTDKLYLGDERRIRQILINLVANAVKFTEHGQVTITTAAEPMGDGDRIQICVTDTGPGISEEAASRLFTPFEQGDASFTRRHGGSGLGLAISRTLAELMGGALEVESTPGVGSRFTLKVDLQEALEDLPEPVEAPAPQGVDGLRVLLADDHPVNRRVAEVMLLSLGVDCECVENGAEAVAAYRRSDFDLILMDVQMPVLDGLEAIAQIRALEAETSRAPIPIFTLSAHAMPEHVQASLRAGADDHLTKPIRAGELLGAIVRAADRGPDAQRAA